MSLMQESDPRFANLERRVGAFVLAALAVVGGVIAFVGVQQGLFTPKAAVVFHDDSGRDLSVGMAVVTRGFRIGKLARLRMTESGKVEATLAIDRPLLRWVRQDSTARIVAKALIGDSQIEVSPGSPGAPALAPGGVISFQRDPELSEIAKRAMEEVKPVLLSVKSLIEYLDDPKGDVKSAISNVNRLSAGLLETREQLDRTLGELSQRLVSVAGRLDALAAGLQTDVLPKVRETLDGASGAARSLDTLVREDLRGLAATLRTDLIPQVHRLLETADGAVAGAGRGVETVDRQLPALLEKLDATLENVRAVTANLVPASREAAGALVEGEALIDESQALVKRTRGMWPFREGATAPERTIDVDSYRSAPRPSGGVGAPRPAAP